MAPILLDVQGPHQNGHSQYLSQSLGSARLRNSATQTQQANSASLSWGVISSLSNLIPLSISEATACPCPFFQNPLVDFVAQVVPLPALVPGLQEVPARGAGDVVELERRLDTFAAAAEPESEREPRDLPFELDVSRQAPRMLSRISGSSPSRMGRSITYTVVSGSNLPPTWNGKDEEALLSTRPASV
ncbi:hypothetical protein PG994_006607 [Apiospora phragmitis]|uniref:Uncharacterized protein n=1 Tax=Apiospora phragmitis TaxID=2905665 RepID=A0ABR1VFH2_9PEZI